MQRIMLRSAIYSAVFAGLTGTLAACGGGGGSASNASTTPAQMGAMPLVISDGPSDDWACVGVEVLGIALIPQGGGAAVTVWSSPSTATYINLAQLDQLGEILGNVSVPAGTYSAAVLTIGANPGDVLLTVAANPESGFPLSGGTIVPANQIQIQGTTGSSGNLTVPVTVNFASALTVTSGQNNVGLDLEFDLGHPAFIVGHTPPAADGATLWAVNFNGPVRHHLVHHLDNLILRHTYGTVTAVSSAALTLSKDFPVYPATNPEKAIASAVSLTIDADGSNGTIVYDLDAGTRTVVDNFSTESALNGKFVRIAARYQEDGTLTAVRVWASSDFSKVWLSPEGHVLNVNSTSDVITVTNEDGIPVPVTVNAATQFFFREPANAIADATPIGIGTAFLADIVRGFKVHVSAVDPLAVNLVAQTVDIETAAFGGVISGASSTGFTYTSKYLIAGDNYSVTLGYIAGSTDNGFDDQDDQITGFKWWDFTFPTSVDFGSSAIGDFVAATNGAVNLGGSIGAVASWGVSGAMWGDGATNASGWYLRDAVLEPSPLPLGTVTTAYANNTFGMTALGATQAATVDVSTTQGSATLVYQVNRSNGMVTITPVDLTSSSGLATMQATLIGGAVVKVWSVPQAPVAPATTGTLRAYVLAYYTGTMPNM